MTIIDADLILAAIDEKIKKVNEFPSLDKIFDVDKTLALVQLRDLRNEIMLMVRVKKFYDNGELK